MAWMIPTEEHLLTRISGVELEAFRNAALAEGQADPVDEVLGQTVDLVRGHIAACPRNILGPAGTIPQMLLGACLDIAVVEVQKRAAGTLMDPDGARKTALENAMRLLERVADCKFAVDLPDEASPERMSGSSPVSSAPAKVFSVDDQRGL